MNRVDPISDIKESLIIRINIFQSESARSLAVLKISIELVKKSNSVFDKKI